ncbi:MAG: nitroreductase family protein [Herbinix sp.]|nr:nitroreductase family protein [Herbinix sp.]
MNTFDAIFSRRSIKHYLNEKLEWDVIANILDFANNLPMLIEGIAVEFKLVSNIETKQGFRGPFSMKAPYYLCISSEEKEDYLLNAGYLMQQLNLYMVSKGIATCFVIGDPGHNLKSNMKYKYVVALAFGKTSSPLYRDSSEANRLPEKDVIVYKEEVSSDIKQVLTAARLAPSSYNSQPWRFVVYKNRIHVFTKKNTLITKALDFSKMVDMGIMLANLLLAADELWVDVTLNKSETLKTKQFHSNEYIRTIAIG